MIYIRVQIKKLHDNGVEYTYSLWLLTKSLSKLLLRKFLHAVMKSHSFPIFFSEKQDYNTRIETIKTLVQKLPPPNRDTMKILFGHLTK